MQCNSLDTNNPKNIRGSKEYWIARANYIGLQDTKNGIVFKPKKHSYIKAEWDMVVDGSVYVKYVRKKDFLEVLMYQC